MSTSLVIRVSRASLVATLLCASITPVFAGGSDELVRCPASMPPLGYENCEIELQNHDFQTKPPGYHTQMTVFPRVSGWETSGPVPVIGTWVNRQYTGIAIGVEPGAFVRQTVHAPQPANTFGAALPTYELSFEASSLGYAARGPMTARLIGIMVTGQEVVLANITSQPEGDRMEPFTMKASPFSVPASLRVEFERPSGEGHPIYIDEVVLTQTKKNR
ncbi:hypothetical protein [Luteibacter aegosomatissinici]|uniref:hypothetical protein n=1 Tax=Luteibacter aegosomatissinici TaxID=2911539 RepID=UPI001FF9DC53|nr:hypothetical protein [Luteibacter aegosomatissinici]UPG95620.1 hypothetical protein L2Y97_05780 [Luteibacter aegosomatissinici]